MSLNSSSSSNDSLLHLHLSYNEPFSFAIKCFTCTPGSFIATSYLITFILLLLPVSIFIIYHGLHQWRQTSSSAATMSHSDSFTYNLVAMEMIGVSGCVLGCCGIYTDRLNIAIVAYFLISVTWFGEMFFHILTCVERYLAVVHPITYLSLRKERGIRIRNISITCVWLLCFLGMSLLQVGNLTMVMNFTLLISSLTIISFCSVSVLCVLIGPAIGEKGGARKRVDQSKQRAFYTILLILGVLVVRFGWNLVWSVAFVLDRAGCVMMTSGFWFNLPSSLVLPLLFLLRAGKLVCWKKNIRQEKN